VARVSLRSVAREIEECQIVKKRNPSKKDKAKIRRMIRENFDVTPDWKLIPKKRKGRR
jgi:UDP-N-acetylmuramyl tripeptide synthase